MSLVPVWSQRELSRNVIRTRRDTRVKHGMKVFTIGGSRCQNHLIFRALVTGFHEIGAREDLGQA